MKAGTERRRAPIVVGSISAVSRVRSWILPEEDECWGMSAGSFSRTAAGNRAYYRRSFPRYLKHYQVPREKKNDNFNGTMRKYTMIGVDLITKGDIKQKKQF